ncbi:MAG TPA: hypothetical protein EYN06_06090, partial [Myxococcales bacterium]|nr:hypothetical protein [Myxococcales bacterium]
MANPAFAPALSTRVYRPLPEYRVGPVKSLMVELIFISSPLPYARPPGNRGITRMWDVPKPSVGNLDGDALMMLNSLLRAAGSCFGASSVNEQLTPV